MFAKIVSAPNNCSSPICMMERGGLGEMTINMSVWPLIIATYVNILQTNTYLSILCRAVIASRCSGSDYYATESQCKADCYASACGSSSTCGKYYCDCSSSNLYYSRSTCESYCSYCYYSAGCSKYYCP